MVKVSLYHRDSAGYHLCDPRGIYSRTTKFVLRVEKEKGKRTWEKLPNGIDYATARRKALERELADAPVPFPNPTKKAPGLTKIADAVDAYINALWADNNLRPRTIKDKQSELRRWAEFTRTERKKEHVEELTRDDLLAFRDELRNKGLAEWTVKTNMTTAVTMLKKNPSKQVTGLLQPKDWPVIEDSDPNPYEVEEVQAMQSVATEDERLLIRVFVGTGCRDMEIAHLEWGDINWTDKTVWIHAKPEYDWRPKTKAGTRKIPISDSLVRDLKLRRKVVGLVFPAPRGGVNCHFLRIMERLAEKAGVNGAGLHRFRDTYITDQVRDGVDLLTLRRWVGHENLETLKLYAESLKAKDQRARDAANRQDKYALAATA